VINKRIVGHIGGSGFLCILIYTIYDSGFPNQFEEWMIAIALCLPLFHFFPVKFNRGSILNARSIGHVGVSVSVCFLMYTVPMIMTKGISGLDLVVYIFIITSVVLSSFHFFHVEPQEVDDEPSLLGLWITSKEMKFRKQIKEGGGDLSSSDSLFGLWVKSRKIKLSNQIKEDSDE